MIDSAQFSENTKAFLSSAKGLNARAEKVVESGIEGLGDSDRDLLSHFFEDADTQDPNDDDFILSVLNRCNASEEFRKALNQIASELGKTFQELGSTVEALSS